MFCSFFVIKFSARQLMNLGFLQEKTNPGGFGSLTALSGIMASCIDELTIMFTVKLPTCIKISKIIFTVVYISS